MEAPHHEDRQRDKRCAIRPGNDVGCGRQLANVEFDVAHHSPEGSDLRFNRNELSVHTLDGDGPVTHT